MTVRDIIIVDVDGEIPGSGEKKGITETSYIVPCACQI